MTIKQLQYYIPRVYKIYLHMLNIKLIVLIEFSFQFPWKDYIINGVFKTAGVKITENDYVMIEDWDYMNKLADIFALYSRFNKK